MEIASDTQPVPLWIDNKPVTSDITFSVVNHGNGSETSAYGATPQIARDAIDSSQVAFESWRETSPWERRARLLKAAQLLGHRSDEVKSILQVSHLPS